MPPPRPKASWTKHVFKAIGEDGKAADAGADAVLLVPDSRPDNVAGNDSGFAMDDIPTQAIIAVSIAVALLIIIMLVSVLVVVAYTVFLVVNHLRILSHCRVDFIYFYCRAVPSVNE